MKVSRNTWHYKFLADSWLKFDRVPEKLCPYVRHIALQTVAQFIVYGLIIWVAATPIWVILFRLDPPPFFFVAIALAGIVLAACSIVALIFGSMIYYDRNIKKLLYRWINKREDAAVWRLATGELNTVDRMKNWARAIHGKICPLVEWKD